MEKKLRVQEFYKKQQLVDFVNSNMSNIEVVTITTSQEAFFYKHFLWYYEK